MVECKNCGAPVEQKYCPQCGQHAGTKRISLGALIKDLPHAIFHVDRGMVYNFIQLLKRPGPAICDYLDGKRKPFFHPASYLVISLVINYLIVRITNLHFYDELELQSMDPASAKAIVDYDAMQWWFLEHTYIYILLAIPLSTLFLYLVFRLGRQSYNIAETAVTILFTISQGVYIQSILYLLFGWVDSGPFLRTLETINVAILILYASHVINQMLQTFPNRILRLVLGLIGGAGLAVIWVASALMLYYLLK